MGVPEGAPVGTGVVDHLALVSADLDATIDFYTGSLEMRLARVVPKRDESDDILVEVTTGY